MEALPTGSLRVFTGEVMAVAWWRIVVLATDLYVLVAAGPWLALLFCYWLMLRRGPYLEREQKRLDHLLMGEGQQRSAWPTTARPGRYAELDLDAQKRLAGLRASISEMLELWPTAETFEFPLPLPWEVLILRAWPLLVGALATRRRVRTLQRLLRQGEAHLDYLEDRRRAAQGIPQNVHSLLEQTRAEVRRIQAVYEAEQEAGTLGIGEIERQLQITEARLAHALQTLDAARPEERPQVVQFADAELAQASAAVADLDRSVTTVAAQRLKARNLLERFESSLRLATERWEGLKTRGATDESIAQALGRLHATVIALTQLGQEHTTLAYTQVAERMASFDTDHQALAAALDQLDEAMRQSKDAIEGDVQELARAQAACDALTQAEPLLDPDESRALVQEASQHFEEAEAQRALGTIEGYGRAIMLSQQARALLWRAQEGVGPLSEQAREAHHLLAAMTPQELEACRARADAMRDKLSAYATHWSGGLVADYAEALAQLDEVAHELTQVPESVRTLAHLEQSSLDETLDCARRAGRAMARAQELVTGLEGELERLGERREELERALARVDGELLPTLRTLSERMLPELRERCQALELAFAQRTPTLGDAAHVDYDEVTGEWLPTILREIDDIYAAHATDLQHLRTTAKEALSGMDKVWTQLTRLEPDRPPRPDEDLARLAADLDAWEAEVERAQESPVLLRELVGSRAALLRRRVEGARRQVVEGRHTLEDLSRRYRKQTRNVQNLRSAVRALRTQGRWPQLDWDDSEAEELWVQTVAAQRAAEQAPTLADALQEMKNAANLLEQAEQAHGRLEYQMSSAVQRLDGELEQVSARLEKQQRIADQVRELGETDQLATLDARNAHVQGLVDMARSATTVDDALRHLREAHEVLSES